MERSVKDTLIELGHSEEEINNMTTDEIFNDVLENEESLVGYTCSIKRWIEEIYGVELKDEKIKVQEEKTMKNYKQYDKDYLGGSDIASLILVGCGDDGLQTMPLSFGFDGSYQAYVVDEYAEIGTHYKKVADFTSWLRVYDDDGLTAEYDGSEINVYRAGEIGCIIQVIK